MPSPKSSFLDKVLGRIDRLDKEGLQTVVQRLARERSFLEMLFNTIEDGVLVVDAEGNFYFDKQIINETALKARLKLEVEAVHRRLTLVVRADKSVRYQTLARLGLLAREAGVRETLLATKPTLARELERAGP